jgi:2-haloacid dehalogenase
MPRIPDTVVFDVGNVLIRWDPRLLYRDFFGDEAAVDRFLADVLPPEWNLEQDRGRSFAEAIAEAVSRRPDQEAAIRAWDTRWHDMVPGEVPGSVAILKALKAADVPLYAITNFSREKFAECQKRFPFLAEDFLDVVVSAHERLVKPDPRIYRVLFERNAIEPAQTVFVDDSLANVEAARGVGMHAIHFTGAADLEAALRDIGFDF